MTPPFSFDPAKDEENFKKHRLRLSHFVGFDRPPVVVPDDRKDYGEERLRGFGRIDGIGYMIAFTLRPTELRLISFRRAHEKEMRSYDRPS